MGIKTTSEAVSNETDPTGEGNGKSLGFVEIQDGWKSIFALLVEMIGKLQRTYNEIDLKI